MNLIKYSVLFLVISLTASAQKTVSFGLSGAYNFPMETIGFGLRANVPVTQRLSVVPRIKYAPDFNTIHDVEAGAHVQFDLWDASERRGSSKPVIYASAGAMYNRWLNYYPNNNPKAGQNNILPEAGLGILSGGNRLKFFMEGHWNILWNESYAEAGLLFYPFNEKSNKRSGKRSKKILRCP